MFAVPAAPGAARPVLPVVPNPMNVRDMMRQATPSSNPSQVVEQYDEMYGPSASSMNRDTNEAKHKAQLGRPLDLADVSALVTPNAMEKQPLAEVLKIGSMGEVGTRDWFRQIYHANMVEVKQSSLFQGAGRGLFAKQTGFQKGDIICEYFGLFQDENDLYEAYGEELATNAIVIGVPNRGDLVDFDLRTEQEATRLAQTGTHAPRTTKPLPAKEGAKEEQQIWLIPAEDRLSNGTIAYGRGVVAHFANDCLSRVQKNTEGNKRSSTRDIERLQYAPPYQASLHSASAAASASSSSSAARHGGAGRNASRTDVLDTLERLEQQQRKHYVDCTLDWREDQPRTLPPCKQFLMHETTNPYLPRVPETVKRRFADLDSNDLAVHERAFQACVKKSQTLDENPNQRPRPKDTSEGKVFSDLRCNTCRQNATFLSHPRLPLRLFLVASQIIEPGDEIFAQYTLEENSAGYFQNPDRKEGMRYVFARAVRFLLRHKYEQAMRLTPAAFDQIKGLRKHKDNKGTGCYAPASPADDIRRYGLTRYEILVRMHEWLGSMWKYESANEELKHFAKDPNHHWFSWVHLTDIKDAYAEMLKDNGQEDEDRARDYAVDVERYFYVQQDGIQPELLWCVRPDPRTKPNDPNKGSRTKKIQNPLAKKKKTKKENAKRQEDNTKERAGGARTKNLRLPKPLSMRNKKKAAKEEKESSDSEGENEDKRDAAYVPSGSDDDEEEDEEDESWSEDEKPSRKSSSSSGLKFSKREKAEASEDKAEPSEEESASSSSRKMKKGGPRKAQKVVWRIGQEAIYFYNPEHNAVPEEQPYAVRFQPKSLSLTVSSKRSSKQEKASSSASASSSSQQHRQQMRVMDEDEKASSSSQRPTEGWRAQRDYEQAQLAEGDALRVSQYRAMMPSLPLPIPVPSLPPLPVASAQRKGGVNTPTATPARKQIRYMPFPWTADAKALVDQWNRHMYDIVQRESAAPPRSLGHLGFYSFDTSEKGFAPYADDPIIPERSTTRRSQKDAVYRIEPTGATDIARPGAPSSTSSSSSSAASVAPSAPRLARANELRAPPAMVPGIRTPQPQANTPALNQSMENIMQPFDAPLPSRSAFLGSSHLWRELAPVDEYATQQHILPQHQVDQQRRQPPVDEDTAASAPAASSSRQSELKSEAKSELSAQVPLPPQYKMPSRVPFATAIPRENIVAAPTVLSSVPGTSLLLVPGTSSSSSSSPSTLVKAATPNIGYVPPPTAAFRVTPQIPAPAPYFQQPAVPRSFSSSANPVGIRTSSMQMGVPSMSPSFSVESTFVRRPGM